LNYKPGDAFHTLSFNWKKVFYNSDSSNCPVSSCKLLQKGCSGEYAGTNLKFEKVAPFDIKAKKNVEKGYDETVCISCTNGKAVVTKNNIRVRQFGEC